MAARTGSLSYILQLDELERVFSNIHAALRPGGVFLFDLSLEDVYRSKWRQSCTIIEDDEAFFIGGYYDERERRGRKLITAFQRNGSWERTDVVFVVRSYAPEEILNILTQAGFTECVCQRSDEDNKLTNDLGPGRACYVARTR